MTDAALRNGMRIPRRFTRAGQDPFDTIEWERRDSRITNPDGSVVFKMDGAEIPAAWSQLATDIVVSKYFRGGMGTPDRETSVRQLVGRVTDTITDWGIKDGYFASAEDAEVFRAELRHMLVNQLAAFNSPVWFNVGVEKRRGGARCDMFPVIDSENRCRRKRRLSSPCPSPASGFRSWSSIAVSARRSPRASRP